MKFRAFEAALIAAVIISVFCGFAFGEQEALAESVIRLHVVANSDSDEDQTLKYRVRDAVLKTAEDILDGAENAKDAQKRLSERLSDIEKAAENAVAENGFHYNVTVTVGEEMFPTRDYETFALPAGNYTSLRVKIGEGGGKNWWCVCFPPICTASAVKWEESGLTDRQVMLITGDGADAEVRFFVIEAAEKIAGFFR